MLKREIVKYIRDRAKNRYPKKVSCEICSTDANLQLHHYNSVSELAHRYVDKTGVNESDVLDWRDEFISSHSAELYTDVVTLCKKHHNMLHDIYGQHPELRTAKLQKKWVATRRDKFNV